MIISDLKFLKTVEGKVEGGNNHIISANATAKAFGSCTYAFTNTRASLTVYEDGSAASQVSNTSIAIADTP